MRSRSGGFDGLWSRVAKTGFDPSPLRTPLESPQFEKRTYFSEIRAHTAVVPLLSSPFATSEKEKRKKIS